MFSSFTFGYFDKSYSLSDEDDVGEWLVNLFNDDAFICSFTYFPFSGVIRYLRFNTHGFGIFVVFVIIQWTWCMDGVS